MLISILYEKKKVTREEGECKGSTLFSEQKRKVQRA